MEIDCSSLHITHNVIDQFIFFKGTMPTTATVDVETTVVSTETPQTPQTTSGNQFYVPVELYFDFTALADRCMVSYNKMTSLNIEHFHSVRKW